jgi:hypothetical protein
LQELLTILEHLSLPPVFSFLCSVCRSCLYFFFWPLCCLSFFDWRLLITSLVSFSHCVVCPSLIDVFWLPLWYLLAIVLSVLLWLTSSDYLFGIFWPLCCLSFDWRILIWYLQTPLTHPFLLCIEILCTDVKSYHQIPAWGCEDIFFGSVVGLA